MILISTGGFSNVPAYVTAKQLIASGLTEIELSGGIFAPDLLEQLKRLTSHASFRVHNYFPPPEKSFVFNLASENEEIAQVSFKHATTAMEWAVELNQPIYSFHAGFLFDPHVKELGKPIKQYLLQARKESIIKFLERVNKLALVAEKLGVQLLIENNVVSLKNMESFGEDAFLMTTPDEAIVMMENTPDNVNLLIDVAHLKVSANTLGYDPVTMLTHCKPWIHAYHLSENDGTKDSNDPIQKDSWFWPFIKKKLDYYSLEIYRVPAEILLQQNKIVQQQLIEQ
jgi:sugar phosphate isomerase/epimerase